MLAEKTNQYLQEEKQITGQSNEKFSPETPFLPEPNYAQHKINEDSFVTHEYEQSYSFESETPFISEYSLGNDEIESVESSMHREIMGNIFDAEFDDATNNLVNELRAVNDSRFSGEVSGDSIESERFLESYVEPLQHEIESLLSRMIHESESLGEPATEANIEHFLEQFEFSSNLSNPAFEDFLGKLIKKVKKAVKAGVKAAKKVGKAVSKYSPANIVLRKIKKLAKPLIFRVLRFALNKIPRRFRPIANKLARRFLKRALREIPESELQDESILLQEGAMQIESFAIDSESATYPSVIINTEFDSLLAGYIIDGDDFESEPAVVDYYSGSQYESSTNEVDLHRARELFIERISNLQEGENFEPAVEEFVTAVLMAARMGIKLIGRKRVVNYLSKIVASIIQRYVGKKYAKPLSRALVNAGMKLLKLETPDELHRMAGETLANTVEGAVESFLINTPAEAYENEMMLEHYAHSAIDKAVSNNFPTDLIRKNLRDTNRRGVWIMRSRGSKVKRFKKYYSHKPIKVSISNKKAKKLLSFGRKNLMGFLKEQLGLPIDTQEIDADLHLYEAINGTTLSAISNAEMEVSGLGTSTPSSWNQFHPLTSEAAAILMPEDVGIGRDVDKSFLESRNRIAVGQRFYFLEIPGAQMIQARPMLNNENKIGGINYEQPIRTSEINVSLDFSEKQITIFNYFSEASSSELAMQLRSGKSASAIIGLVEKSLRDGLSEVLSGTVPLNLVIKRETQASEKYIESLYPSLKTMGSTLSKMVINGIVSHLINKLKAHGDELVKRFIKATEDPADGVTIIFSLSQMDEVLNTLSNNSPSGTSIHSILTNGVINDITYNVRSGFHKS